MRKTKKWLSILSVLLVLLIGTKSLQIYAVGEEKHDSTSVRLQDDFYEAVNGEWMMQAKIKPGYAQESLLTELSDQAAGDIQAIFEELLNKKDSGDLSKVHQMMITLYGNIMNKEERNRDGIEPIKKYIDKIRGVKEICELNKVLSEKEVSLFNSLIDFQITSDTKDSQHYMLEIGASKLLLGDPDEYTMPTIDTKKQKEALGKYVIQLLTLSGYTQEEAREKLSNALVFEGMLAPSMIGREMAVQDENIYEKIYNVYNINELSRLAPELCLPNGMKKLGYSKANKIVVQEPEWLKKLNKLYNDDNLEVIKDYLEIHLLITMSPYLSQSFEEAHQTYMSTLYGIVGKKTEEQIALQYVNQVFESEIGKLYVEKNFTAEAKEDIEEMIQSIIKQYKKRIMGLDWMSEETKGNAVRKLDTMGIKVGYPDKWEDYKGLKIKSYEEGSSLAQNIINVALFERTKELKMVNKIVDKTRFEISPQVVNAGYSPSNNDITFPAAILQAPLYDIHQEFEANLGAIGVIIAHEITHAFDPTGAKFDEMGNMKEWWTEEDYKKFEEKTKKVEVFYNQIEVIQGYNVNGALTLGENIADIGAVATTLDIMREKSNADYRMFFEAWARAWRMVASPEYQIRLLKEDVHSPAKVRVNAVLPQFEEFHQAYSIDEKDKMYVEPGRRLKIW